MILPSIPENDKKCLLPYQRPMAQKLCQISGSLVFLPNYPQIRVLAKEHFWDSSLDYWVLFWEAIQSTQGKGQHQYIYHGKRSRFNMKKVLKKIRYAKIYLTWTYLPQQEVSIHQEKVNKTIRYTKRKKKIYMWSSK